VSSVSVASNRTSIGLTPRSSAAHTSRRGEDRRVAHSIELSRSPDRRHEEIVGRLSGHLRGCWSASAVVGARCKRYDGEPNHYGHTPSGRALVVGLVSAAVRVMGLAGPLHHGTTLRQVGPRASQLPRGGPSEVHATVGSFGGSGRRWRNRPGLAVKAVSRVSPRRSRIWAAVPSCTEAAVCRPIPE
jgi:hypothetical protein